MDGGDDNKKTRDYRGGKIDAWETALRIRGVLVLRQLVDLETGAPEFVEARVHAVALIHREIIRAITTYDVEACGHTLDEHAALCTIIEAEATIDTVGRDPVVVAFLMAGSKADLAHCRTSCRTLMALVISTTSATQWT